MRLGVGTRPDIKRHLPSISVPTCYRVTSTEFQEYDAFPGCVDAIAIVDFLDRNSNFATVYSVSQSVQRRAPQVGQPL